MLRTIFYVCCSSTNIVIVDQIRVWKFVRMIVEFVLEFQTISRQQYFRRKINNKTMSETIALIPARGGSERILRKNIRKFSGRPIIAWPIELAKKSKIFNRIVVSTDDHEIAETALQEGADVPFIRPSKLSDSGTGITPVVKHAILQLQQSGTVVSELCLIYATAPFLQIDALKKGLELLHAEDCDYVISVTTFAFPIQRAVKRNSQRAIGDVPA